MPIENRYKWLYKVVKIMIAVGLFGGLFFLAVKDETDPRRTANLILKMLLLIAFGAVITGVGILASWLHREIAIRSGRAYRQFNVLDMFVRQDKVYLARAFYFAEHQYLCVAPVFVAALDVDPLLSEIEKIMAIHPPDTPRFWSGKPLLEASGAPDWAAFVESSLMYRFTWTEIDTHLEMTRINQDGQWESDPEKFQVFPKDKPLSEILEIVLADVQKRKLESPA